MSEYWFDEKAAGVAVNFFERMLVHVKGEWAGEPFRLQGWQKKIVRDIFGWKRSNPGNDDDGTRRYRTVYIEVPRKNGKSTLAAGLALTILYVDNEYGAEVYSAAGDKDQASIVFDLAKAMVQSTHELERRTEVYKKSLFIPETMSVYRVLSADAFSKHGLNAHGIVVDELHVQPNRELVDTLVTSTGARRQPLVILITTAGYDKESVCWEYHERARQVKEGLIEDESFYPVMYGAEEGDDWQVEETWRKVNPGLGVSVKLDYLRGESERARQTPAYENTFRRLHLNQWTSQESRWIPMEEWDQCGNEVNWKLLEGATCYGGLDLASSSDLASFVLDFPSEVGEEEQHTWLARFWIPKDNIVEKSRQDRVNYEAWVRLGFVNATEGNVIDYGFITKEIVELGEKYDIQEIPFDRWGAVQISQELAARGFTMVGFGQGFQSMSSPTKDLLRLVLGGRLRHGKNPVLRWMADNVMVSTDAAGNVKMNKQKSRSRIDGMIAGVMALDRATRHANDGSVYQGRGLRTL
jgi:phage terminase large subunit-like protein